MDPRLHHIASFVASTREAVFVREVDRVLFIRPDKSMGLNESATALLASLYAASAGAEGVEAALSDTARRLGGESARVVDDAVKLIAAVGAILNEDWTPREALRFEGFERKRLAYPTLAEIALTYGCNARCAFCYASSPHRAPERRPMTTAQVRTVMERIFHEAHVPSLSFTGGEATLRPDLPELIRQARAIGFRVNLITNGVRLGDEGFARTLVDAGLHSTQISLEAATAELHDRIVGLDGAFDRTVAGVRNASRLGIHVHTNTTLCGANLDAAADLVRFVARDLGLRTLSMNMLIRTGEALDDAELGISYATIAARLPGLLEVAEQEGVRLVWYSPTPYCVFNPVLHGLGARACACVDGILSVDPTGQVLPCSSFEDGIGSLLDKPFERIYGGRAARWWRERRFVPPLCKGCPDVDLCAGACPLYWDAATDLTELPGGAAVTPRELARWRRDRKKGGSFGVRQAGKDNGGEP